ncbi:hypothetical protein [Gymnodinialimonas sp.]
MTLFQILPAIAFALTAIFVLTRVTASAPARPGLWRFPAVLCALFTGWTLYTIVTEGVLLVWVNHSSNAWGNQVWFDLLLAVSLSFAALVHRARSLGMSLLPWALFVIATASIGLLAMLARILYLQERPAA